eukprot:m.211112 g.211112  ORF g.211112 m.211112 type:complete len:178 (+) comp17146_c1_seq62:2303-2836(+)
MQDNLRNEQRPTNASLMLLVSQGRTKDRQSGLLWPRATAKRHLMHDTNAACCCIKTVNALPPHHHKGVQSDPCDSKAAPKAADDVATACLLDVGLLHVAPEPLEHLLERSSELGVVGRLDGLDMLKSHRMILAPLSTDTAWLSPDIAPLSVPIARLSTDTRSVQSWLSGVPIAQRIL